MYADERKEWRWIKRLEEWERSKKPKDPPRRVGGRQGVQAITGDTECPPPEA
jgi:hypothetical protein